MSQDYIFDSVLCQSFFLRSTENKHLSTNDTNSSWICSEKCLCRVHRIDPHPAEDFLALRSFFFSSKQWSRLGKSSLIHLYLLNWKSSTLRIYLNIKSAYIYGGYQTACMIILLLFPNAEVTSNKNISFGMCETSSARSTAHRTSLLLIARLYTRRT